MVSGFLLDVTSGTTLATLDPASGETNAERSEQRAGRNLGPWWPAGELNRPDQKAPTSGHPVEQDVKIVHFQQLFPSLPIRLLLRGPKASSTVPHASFHLCAPPLPAWARSELGAPHFSLQGCRTVPSTVPTSCLFALHEDPTCPQHQGLGPSAWIQKPGALESWDLPVSLGSTRPVSSPPL